MNKLPCGLQDFRAYLDNQHISGVVDVQLPDIEFATMEVKGAGIGGTIDMPVPGEINSCQATINFRTHTDAQATLAGLSSPMLTFRGSQMVNDPQTGANTSQRVAITIRGPLKKSAEGKLESGATTDSSVEIEVLYYKKVIDDVVVLEWDKLAKIFRVNGVDLMAKVRSDMGMDAVGTTASVPVRI